MRSLVGIVSALVAATPLLLTGCGGSAGGGAAPALDAGVDAAPDTAPDAPDAEDAAPDGPAGPVAWSTHILPLFEANGCPGCHNADVAKGGHRLHTLDALLTTGANAPVVIACDPDGSVLVQKLEDPPPFGDRMPLGGPYLTADEIALVRLWVSEGTADLGPCPEVEPPLPLVEERQFRVSDRAPLLTTSVPLPDGLAGTSPLFAVQARRELGFVGAGEGYARIDRDGEVEVVVPGWDGDLGLGEVRAAAELGDLTLVATEIGLRYLTEDRLWPSPIDEVLRSAVTALLADESTSPGRPSMWMATQRGLFQLVGDELFEIRPSQEAPGTAAVALAMGPDPQDPDASAVWVAFGEQVYAVRPDDDGVMAYTFEIAFDDPVIDLEADAAGHVWVVTQRGLFLRRPPNVVGVARWVHWVLPQGQSAVDVAVHADGATWVLTDGALYRALDDSWRWQLVLGAPASDVVGMAVGDQGSVWLTRRTELLQLSPTPVVGVVGLAPLATLDAFPELEVDPSFPDQVRQVSITVDDCAPVLFEAAPYVVTGGALVWRECLAAGEHLLHVEVDYDGLDGAVAEVPFGWIEREEVITWRGHVEPQIYARSCARPGCHIDGFAPDGYDAWVEKIDPIIQRTDPATVQGRMPPNGPRLTAAERLLIQWWRDDGFQVE